MVLYRRWYIWASYSRYCSYQNKYAPALNYSQLGSTYGYTLGHLNTIH